MWRGGHPPPPAGPTDHGLTSLALSLAEAPGAEALVACPPPVRRCGDWDFDPPDVHEALAWLLARAGSAPLVLLLPFEWHAGPGDGTHSLGPAIAAAARRPDTVVVAPTGNYGDRHALWHLHEPTDISWTPAGDQTLSLWCRGDEVRVCSDGGEISGEQVGPWWHQRFRAASALRLSAHPGGGTCRLRGPFPSTGALRLDPPGEGLGAVGFPACRPDVLAVGSDHWTSARGLGGPDALGPFSRVSPRDPRAAVRGSSVAAAVVAGRLLMGQTPETP